MSNDQQPIGSPSSVDDVKELPPRAVAKLIYICKEEILQEALKSISLEICESKTCMIGDGEIVGSICIDAPSHGPYSMLHRKKIFGDWKSTEEDALESARLAALLYLQKTGLIFVDDINKNELTKCEAKLLDCWRKLLAASNWANMFQEETKALKMKLVVAYKENEKMVEKHKAYGMKEEAADPQADAVDIKEEAADPQPDDGKNNVPAPHMFHTTKESSTPPPSKHEAAYRCLRYEKQPNLTTVPVKRPLFKGQAVSVHGLQHTALARDQQKSCTDVETLAPLDTYGDLLVLEDAVKKEFPDVLPSLLSRDKNKEVTTGSLSQTTSAPAKLPCFKRKKRVLVAAPTPGQATLNRKRRALIVGLNRSRASDSVAEEDMAIGVGSAEAPVPMTVPDKKMHGKQCVDSASSLASKESIP